MGLEPTAFCLASRRSTTELRPLTAIFKYRKTNKNNRFCQLKGVSSQRKLLNLDDVSLFHRFSAGQQSNG